jgi:hypothetical protein
MEPDISNGVVGAVAIIVGGFGVKFIDRYFRFSEKRIKEKGMLTSSIREEHASIRKELLAEIEQLREDRDRSQEDADEWREKYTDKAVQLSSAQAELAILKDLGDTVKAYVACESRKARQKDPSPIK